MVLVTSIIKLDDTDRKIIEQLKKMREQVVPKSGTLLALVGARCAIVWSHCPVYGHQSGFVWLSTHGGCFLQS